MKKLIFLLLVLMLGISLSACNSGSDLKLDYDEFIGTPHNLVISGKTLSWGSVTDAKSYNVYVNDELQENVKTTTFDFSDLEGNKLVFRVQTVAPRGYQDSVLSVSIAYVENKDTEVTNVQQILSDNGMDVPQGFAEELVNKGMTSDDLSDFMEGYDSARYDMESMDSFSDMFDVLDSMVSLLDNPEAMVSAAVKYIIPNMLQNNIDNAQSSIDYYEEMIDMYPDSAEYYQSMMDQVQTQLDQQEELQQYFMESPDDAVLSITATISYLMSIENAMSDTLIDTINSLIQTDDVANLNIDEVMVVKDEMVAVLRETMPSMQDMVMLFEFENSVMQITDTNYDVGDEIDNYETKSSAQVLMMIEAFINFLDGIDRSYFESIQEFANSDLTSEMVSAEVTILTIEYFATFKDDNQGLLDDIENVFTDDEREIMFNNSIDYADGLGVDGPRNALYPINLVNFQQLLYLDSILRDSFDVALDKFVETDGEIVRLITIANSFTLNYSDGTYYNYALDETFSRTEYNEKQTDLQIKVAWEFSKIFGPVIEGLNQDDYDNLVDFTVTIIPFEEMFAYSDIFDSIDFEGFRSDILTAALTVSDQQLEFFQNLSEFLRKNDVFENWLDVQNDINVYYQGNYGPNYAEDFNATYSSDNFNEYAGWVFFSQNYQDFMTNSNRGLVDDILAEMQTYFTGDGMEELYGVTVAEWNDIFTNINDMLDYLDQQTDIIQDYDYNNLTDEQKTVIDDTIQGMQTYVDNINQAT